MTADSPLLSQRLPCENQADLVFAEPWEAQVFSIIVTLSKAGHFTWAEWVECFAREVAAATAIEARGETPPTYYEQWLAAAEKLLADKGMTSNDQLRARKLGLAAAGTAHVLKNAVRKPIVTA
ncbi:MAG: nitrile hydratase accessory protein [Burkholderiales bacterium]|nr:nitrile hydratase accessory protein [Burkholderiales bacterium]